MTEALFVDTGAWIALEVENDRHHPAALEFARGKGPEYRWVTTNWVVAEVLTFLRRHTTHAAALRFGENVRASRLLTVHRVGAGDEERAWTIFRDYEDEDFGMVDCTSFAVMEALDVATAFSFDRHFGQFGWVLVPPVESV